jgi:hypothetical protein
MLQRKHVNGAGSTLELDPVVARLCCFEYTVDGEAKGAEECPWTGELLEKMLPVGARFYVAKKAWALESKEWVQWTLGAAVGKGVPIEKWEEIGGQAAPLFGENKVQKDVEYFVYSEEGQGVSLLRSEQTNVVSGNVDSTLGCIGRAAGRAEAV